MAAPNAAPGPVAPNGWAPSASGLSQMVALFGAPDPSLSKEQRDVMFTQLAELRKHPEYEAYLVYIVLHLGRHAADVAQWMPHGHGSQVEEIRACAGLELKNRTRTMWQSYPAPLKEYIKSAALCLLGDSHAMIRQTGGTIVTTVAKEGLLAWPGVLEHLVAMLDTGKFEPMDGGFNALMKICEDMPRALDSDALKRPLNFLIPKFISFFRHGSKEIRRYAIATTNVFLKSCPNALLTNMELYKENLFFLAGNDPAPEIRRRVCQAFVILLDTQYAQLHANIRQVVEFMLMASQDADEGVCLEAVEFWPVYCKLCKRNPSDRTLLRDFLPHLVPLLLKSMRYSDDELAAMGEDEDEDDEAKPDRQQDLKRFQRKGQEGGHYPSEHELQHQHDMAASGDAEDGDEEEFDEELEDADWMDDEVTTWTLRKCAAAALDKLADVYRGDLIAILLPLLEVALNTKSPVPAKERECWVVRESAVLALGAVAEGCFDQLRSFLPQLVPFLIANFLTDKRPLVRSITCWTLSRYIKWIINETVMAHGGDHAPLFQPLLKSLLTAVVDRNKKVQEAACSAFATLEEESRMMLVPYLADILKTLMFAFQKYQAKNMLILYDCLGTLCEAVHEKLNTPELIAILMPPLMQKWNTVADNSIDIFPLLECLTAVAQALRRGFFGFAEPVFGRCMHIVESNLLAQKEADRIKAAGGDADDVDKEFVVCALDLLSGLAEGLEESVEPLVGAHAPRMLGLLYLCAQDLDPDVRQSAFALLGDLAKTCMGHLRPHLDKFVPIAARNLNPEHFSVCNNASWCIGEMAVRAGGDAMGGYVADVLQYLVLILQKGNPDMMIALLENASITVGRLAVIAPAQVAAQLESFLPQWVEYLSPLKEHQEKEHAFRGLIAALQVNPQAIFKVNAFPALAAALASWQEPSAELNTLSGQLCHYYKQLLAQQWPACYNTCDPEVKKILSARYQL